MQDLLLCLPFSSTSGKRQVGSMLLAGMTGAGGVSAELSTSPWATGSQGAAAALLQVLRCGLNIALGSLIGGGIWIPITHRAHYLLGLVAGRWAPRKVSRSQGIFCFHLLGRVLPESARWLVTKGKIEEAKKVLQKAASINKRTIPPDLLEQVPKPVWGDARPQKPASEWLCSTP